MTKEEIAALPSTDVLKAIDTIGHPHPYCITPNHVGYASDHYGGMLTEEAIKDAEKHGAHCGVKGCKLSYKEHETGLLIAVRADEVAANTPEFKETVLEYSKSLLPLIEGKGIAGFAYMLDPEGKHFTSNPVE